MSLAAAAVRSVMNYLSSCGLETHTVELLFIEFARPLQVKTHTGNAASLVEQNVLIDYGQVRLISAIIISLTEPGEARELYHVTRHHIRMANIRLRDSNDKRAARGCDQNLGSKVCGCDTQPARQLYKAR